MTIEPVKCRTAEELLDALHPRSWPFDGWGWLYRGHGNSDWRLLPSAFRYEAWEGFQIIDHVLDPAPDDIEDWERLLLVRYYRLLDHAGEHIPNGQELMKRLPTNFGTTAKWPDPVFDQLLALAQHNGVPTRLLDWSRSRHVAAYFAAVDALKNNWPSLDIWALHGHFVDRFGGHFEHLKCRIVRPLQHGNPNLHAQAGVFSVCQGDLGQDGKFIALDELLGAIPGEPGEGPCLRRFQLPRSEARDLLRALYQDQIDAVRLFPGHVGIVRALREERWRAF